MRKRLNKTGKAMLHLVLFFLSGNASVFKSENEEDRKHW
jgi:hypothetical protein